MFPREPQFARHKASGKIMRVWRIIAKGHKADEQEVGYGFSAYGDCLCEYYSEEQGKKVREWYKPNQIESCLEDGTLLPPTPHVPKRKSMLRR